MAEYTGQLRHLAGLPDGCGLLETTGFRLTGQVLKQSVECGEIMAVTGKAGLGKTFAVDYHVRASGHPWVWVQIGPAPRPKEVTSRLLKEITGGFPKGTLYELSDLLVDELRQNPRIVVIDEAQHLGSDGLQQVRYLHDRGADSFPLVLTGGEGCAETLQSDPQLADRVGGWVRFEPIPKDRLVGLLAGYHSFYAASDPELLLRVDDLYANGVLRRWARLLKTALALQPSAARLTPELARAVLAVIKKDPAQS